jgi:putative ABC transport system substrate-binding protein
VIVANETPAALAAKAATTTIPIVFVTRGDPVALGLVASLNRPAANLTGSAILMDELAPKRLQLLRELMPNAALFGVLADPAFRATQSVIADLQAATASPAQPHGWSALSSAKTGSCPDKTCRRITTMASPL